jgi:MFS family permease
MVHGTNVIASLLLARTAFDYLGIVYEQRASWVEALWQWVYVVPAVVVGTTLILAWYRSRGRNRTTRRSDEQRRPISFTVFGMLSYGVAGTIFAGVLTTFPDSLWRHPPLSLVVATVAIELLGPGALLVGLVLAVPSLGPPRDPRLESDSTGEHEDEGYSLILEPVGTGRSTDSAPPPMRARADAPGSR